MMSDNKPFRCGYCGQPANADGSPLTQMPDDAERYDQAELVHGFCCASEPEPNLVQVTREMAADAGDKSLEGQWIEW